MFNVKKVFCFIITLTMVLSLVFSVDQPAKAGAVVTYPMPSCYSPSTNYSVTVDGTTVPVIRYDDNTTAEYQYAQFSFSGTVNIMVTASENIASYKIRPESYNINGTVSGKNLTFNLSQSRYLVIQINSLKKLILIADPIESNVPASSGAGIFNVKNSPYSADSTGTNSVTAVLQKAIDDANAAGGGIVYVPTGVYKTASLTMKSNVNLYLGGGAVLRGTAVASDYTQDNLGSTSQAITTFIKFTEGATNMKVYGRGTIDCNGEKLYDNSGGSDPSALRICALRPNKNSDVTIDGIIASHSTTWTVVPQQSDNVTIKNVKVLNSGNRNENDGIDINACQNVTVQHCFTHTNDDSLCAKATVAGAFKGVIQGPDEDLANVTFDDIVVFGNCAGAKVGMQGGTPTYNIWFKNIEVLQASRGIAIEHKYGTATLEGIHFVNINVEDLKYRIYEPYPIQMEIHTSGANVKNVEVSNVTFKKFGDAASSDGYDNANSYIYGKDSSSIIKDVTFTNLKIAGKVILDKTSGHMSTNSYTSGITFASTKYEVEDLTTSTSSGDSQSDFLQHSASNGSYNIGNFSGVGDYVQYTTNITEAGTYKIVVRQMKASNRVKWQLSIDGTNQGSEVDGYSLLADYQEIDLGTKTFTSTGNKIFKFTVTGRNASNTTAYKTSIDAIKLVKQ